MIIDIFRNKELFDSLSKYNDEVDEITVNLPKGIDIWFDSSQAVLNPLNRTYPDIDPIQYDKKWCLHFSIPNYLSLFLIDLLYKDKKDVLIEDACTGTGEFVYFLSKLGYKNFHIIDNWCQVPSTYFQNRMAKGNIVYNLNDLNANPTVINLSCYPIYPKKIADGILDEKKEGQVFFDNRSLSDYEKHMLKSYINPSCELFCNYLLNGKDNIERDLAEAGMIYIGHDEDKTCHVYCRKDKYEEFKEKLKPYEVITSE